MRDGNWKLYWPPIPEARAKDPADNIPFFRYEREAHIILDIDTSLPQRTLSAPRALLLFDLEADPYEHDDASARHPERVKGMQRQWDSWFEGILADWHKAQRQTRTNG